MTLRAVARSGSSGGGTVESVTGTMINNTDPANPVVESDATKVTTTAIATRVYATDGSGGQTTLAYNAGAVANTVVIRSAGSAVRTGTPVATSDATPKSYVDSTILGTTTSQQAAIPDLVADPTASDINTILAALRNLGLIAS